MADFIVLSCGEARGGQHSVLGKAMVVLGEASRLTTKNVHIHMNVYRLAPRRWSDQPQHASATLLPRLTISYVLYPGLPQNKT